MSKIQEYLDKIKTAVYGKDVRQSIVNAIQKCYDDGKAGITSEQLSQIEQNRKDISKLSEEIVDKATIENSVIKFYKSGETDKLLFSVDLSSIGGSGGLDLNNLTMSVSAVENGNRLTLSDGTTTKSVDIPSVSLTNEQISSIVNTWLDEHPEATTTVADGSIGYKHLDESLKSKLDENVSLYDFENSTIENYFDVNTSEVVLKQGGYYGDGNKFGTTSYSYVKVKVLSGKTYCHNLGKTPFSIIFRTLDDVYIGNSPINSDNTVIAPTHNDKEIYMIITWVGDDKFINNFCVVEGTETPLGTEKPLVYVPWLKAGCVPNETIPEFVIEKQSIKSDLLEQKIPPYVFDGIGCTNYFDAEYNIANAEVYSASPIYYFTAWNYLPAGTYTINTCFEYYIKSLNGEVSKVIIGTNGKNNPTTFTVTKDAPYFRAMIHCASDVNNLKKVIIQKGDTVNSDTTRKYILDNFSFKGGVGYYPTHWDCKNYVAIGDSITRGYAPGDTDENIVDGSQITPCYADFIANKLNMNLKNLGADGASVRTTLQNNKVTALQNAGFTPDVATIYLGANDMAGISLGTIDDEYTSYSDCTFYAGMKQIVKEFQDAFPMCTIILIGNTPTEVHTESKIKQYNQAKQEIAEKYNVLYCDLYNGCGFNLNNEIITKKFRLDSIHPNHNAHLVMGSRLTGFIASH